MLKNIHPLLSGGLLATLERLRPGQTFLLTNDGDGHDDLIDAPVETVLDAVLSVLPLAATDRVPLQGWLADPADEAAYDVAFTVQGMAADAERRPLRMVLIDTETARRAADDASARVRVATGGSAWAFLLRAGE